jgi:hypothetical protein
MRNTEVRYTGTAVDGPYEQHDLSEFCSSENHAVKVGAYIISKRRHVTHRVQLGVKPDAFNPTLAAGDLVRVRLERVASTGADSVHDYLYEVDRIGKSITGEVRIDLTHFPVDASLASIVAQVGGIGGLGGFGGSGGPGEVGIDGGGSPTADNPEDQLDKQSTPCIQMGSGGHYVGQTYFVDGAPSVQWLADGVAISGATSNTYTTTESDIGKIITAQPAETDASPYGYCNPQDDPGTEGYAGSSNPPPPTGGANPLVRVYWIRGNIFCLDGGCYQGKAIDGFITVNYSYFLVGNMRFTPIGSYPVSNQCICVGSMPDFGGCVESIANPVSCDDLGCCPATIWFDSLELFVDGTWMNNSSVISTGIAPTFAVVYAPT